MTLKVNRNPLLLPKLPNSFLDFYWRDYKGIIPKDALAAGYDSENETTYVAQVLHENLLIPGEINDSDKRAYYEWALQKYEATENVKVGQKPNEDSYE